MKCYCQSGLNFEQCCQPLLTRTKLPANAEQLMRSRYSAYSLNNAEYIQQSYAPEKQVEHPVKEISEWANQCKFVKLDILSSDLSSDETQFVEFVASYIHQGVLEQLHERSRFIKENEQWYYLDGEIFETALEKLNRNQNCPCGSGKKYKRCCCT